MRRKRGVALVTALWLILVLGVVATEVTRSAYGVADTADNVRSRMVARYAAESGIVLASTRIEDTLAVLRDSTLVRSFLNRLERGSLGISRVDLGDARFQLAVVDVNARLDVNRATAEQLMTLFSSVAGMDESRAAATAIRNRIEYGKAGDLFRGPPPAGVAKPLYTTPLRSLSELLTIPGVGERVANGAAPFLTVDGDGHVNQVTASAQVRAAAGGDLRDTPSRLLLISRGWKEGRPLTFEIQAVYALEYGKVVLVSWRERDL
ncbi:MAG: general secretion pathway protein GspK [Gemmatimonadaceae bacterium]|nr:general secretion pathway protein GspK [Gemmatimonadaceae bacterium]